MGQLYGSNREFQSNCWAEFRNLGQTCAIFVRPGWLSALIALRNKSGLYGDFLCARMRALNTAVPGPRGSEFLDSSGYGVRLGLGRVALPLCATAHSLYTVLANIFGVSISETTMVNAARDQSRCRFVLIFILVFVTHVHRHYFVLPRTAHPLYTVLANIFGASISETRPDPRCGWTGTTACTWRR